ncbi:circadian clock KaiB family protein [Thiospirillum jenense]|uniref:Circadian clock protein KaiB n=1 Tax=Thiospirillum jenense TaxID=1653858 RepID=A0A839HGC3_9GAMM|nr:circadian clock KaiB family protein [Thiospirillum jenense]MBB1126188.1 circadian clock protein KaiB [Thiospirillum jenense]
MATYHLMLFHAGDSELTCRALDNLRHFCYEQFGDDYALELVDVLLNPECTIPFHILLTPTVVVTAPAPERRLIGDLSDVERLRRGLGMLAATR